MFWLCLAALAATAAAQGSYDLESRVSFPGKSSSIGPLYSSGINVGQGFRDNSYEDNIVTPTPSPTPLYRNAGGQPAVSNAIIIYPSMHHLPATAIAIFFFFIYYNYRLLSAEYSLGLLVCNESSCII